MPPGDRSSRILLLPLPIAAGHEWVGGRSVSPFFITAGDPYRPELVFWVELPEEIVVSTTLIGTDGPRPSFTETLLETMRRPLVGPARRPERVRVSDLALAAELRTSLGSEIRIDLGPTPEIERVIEHLADALTAEDDQASYFEDGRVSLATVAKLFEAAEILWTIAPWKVATDDQVLRVDVPQLDVEGACLSIIGNLGESLGFLLFPSLEGYRAFLDAADKRRPADRRIDFGTSFLALNFERRADLPAGMRREVQRHRWRVAGPQAYPLVDHHERDGLARPLTERDVEIVAACALSLGSFFIRNEDAFRQGRPAPISESFSDESGRRVRFTMPYEAFDLFEDVGRSSARGRRAPATPRPAAPVPPARPRAGRNDPCPCGSGRKYKKCHLRDDEAAAGPDGAPVHTIDERLVFQMSEWAERRFGEEWLRATVDFADAGAARSLFLPWSVYHFTVRSRPVVDWFLEARGERLSSAERTWLDAQRSAWLTVWEVLAVEPGRSITLRDLLSGIEHTVHEVSGSRTLVKRDAVLGRVVTCEEQSVICGVHPRPLPPSEAAAVVRQMQARLRRKRAIPVEWLRDEAVGRHLIEKWEAAVTDLDARRAIPPDLRNTDGHALRPTVDRFDVTPGTEPLVEARLATLEGAVPPEPGEEARHFDFVKAGNAMHRGWDNTTIGTAWVTSGELRLETNSTERADDLRRRVESACAGLVHFRDREHTDVQTLLAKSSGRGAEPPEPAPPEAQRLLLEMKQRHYAAWVDQPLPILSGKTPREAMRTAAGRARVDVLLKDIENRESRLARGEQLDLTALRSSLGLEG